ncbi:MAG: hypothetical protein L0220_02815 [Acidobacteria bacterium]|nr:hypothetical protein [Acidobacteriota bacterium]
MINATKKTSPTPVPDYDKGFERGFQAGYQACYIEMTPGEPPKEEQEALQEAASAYNRVTNLNGLRGSYMLWRALKALTSTVMTAPHSWAGRKIGMDPGWRKSFKKFFKDMGPMHY